MQFSCSLVISSEAFQQISSLHSQQTGGSKSQTTVVVIVCGRRQRHSTTKISKRWSSVAILPLEQSQPNAHPSKELANAKSHTNELPAVVQL